MSCWLRHWEIDKFLSEKSIACVGKLCSCCSVRAGMMLGDAAIVTSFLIVMRIVASQNGTSPMSVRNSRGKGGTFYIIGNKITVRIKRFWPIFFDLWLWKIVHIIPRKKNGRNITKLLFDPGNLRSSSSSVYYNGDSQPVAQLPILAESPWGKILKCCSRTQCKYPSLPRRDLWLLFEVTLQKRKEISGIIGCWLWVYSSMWVQKTSEMFTSKVKRYWGQVIKVILAKSHSENSNSTKSLCIISPVPEFMTSIVIFGNWPNGV